MGAIFFSKLRMEIPDIPLTNEDPFGKITRPMAGEDHFPEAKIFKSVLYYSILILGGPVITFFIAKNLILSAVFQWGSDEVKTNVVSAIASGCLVIQ